MAGGLHGTNINQLIAPNIPRNREGNEGQTVDTTQRDPIEWQASRALDGG